LLRWLIVLFMATMVDEIFLGFTGLLLRDRLHASITTTSLILALGMIGGMIGLIALERLLARRPESQHLGIRLLPWLALLTLAGVAALLLAQDLWLAALALGAIGFGATGWYPVAKAAAYGRLPGRPGMLLAITGLLTPLELVLPAVVGGLADRFGLVVALGFLGVAPLGVLLFAPRISAKSDKSSKTASVSRETS
jgi:hypothetical protein